MINISKKTIFFSVIFVSLFLFSDEVSASNPAPITLPFTYSCNTAGRLSEADIPTNSTSPYWHLSSGAYLRIADGVCRSQYGALPLRDIWRVLYGISNPIDTDGGYYPQNVYRLHSRLAWADISQQAIFYINKQNVSVSNNRQGYSGLLFFSRYQNQNNLYYAGVRDDGHVVIKSKKNGVYTTLAEATYYPGTYNRISNPTLLPMGKWFGMKMETKTNPNNTVNIKLYMDKDNTGIFSLVLQTTDSNNPILSSGNGGLRGDFRDFAFDNFTFKAI